MPERVVFDTNIWIPGLFSENHIRAVLYDLRRISERVEIAGELRALSLGRLPPSWARRSFF
jgi:hypothetical protein